MFYLIGDFIRNGNSVKDPMHSVLVASGLVSSLSDATSSKGKRIIHSINRGSFGRKLILAYMVL